MFVNVLKATEKWSSICLSAASKNQVAVENHISVHSNLNLNGFDNDKNPKSKGTNFGTEVI